MINILVTNDDGFDALGIQHLRQAASELGNVVTVAPHRNYSGASSSLTLTAPINVERMSDTRYRIGGTPSDCVHLALTSDFLPFVPDLIVSGINSGANMGDDTIYSGTVAAVIEGHLFGIPGFAFSMAGKSESHYAKGAIIAKDFIQRFQQNCFNKIPLLNINIPDSDSNSGEIIATRLGRRHPAQAAKDISDKNDRSCFVIGDAGHADDDAPGTDFHAIAEGHISVTPLMVDLTNFPQIAKLRAWLA